ncbi:putative cytosol aminopeptidase [Boseongicola aestuarii]|uniref:Putative cytosol aminopeptidase n=2 Tax=Boseongicola aestuarii TaxID=1470561 RepID=A0A238IYW3_9RHOB|nr:putative cytosol aminopeptidase [Boseongicola aestuarii]
MTSMTFASSDAPTRPLHLVSKEGLEDWRLGLDARAQAFVQASAFSAGAGQVVLIPGETGEVVAAAGGVGDAKTRARKRFVVAGLRANLPEGAWEFQTSLEGDDLAEAALGWLLAGYRFEKYAAAPPPKAMLVAPKGVDAALLERVAAGEALTRNLINTPANDMGPDELEAAARDLATAHGAEVSVTAGKALEEGYPLIHTVGRASPRAPRLIEMTWGSEGPRVTLVGKGVCFDTGGLNLKPGASMGLMKKDMGGAANVLGLAHMIMDGAAPVRLRVLIPAVENAVAGDAFRPGDILTSRKGLTVEINNTDAEGRLVLADALSLADEGASDLIISMATLTGAARVAVGPDIAPYYATDASDAAALEAAAAMVRDPVWRMPFWLPYETMIEPGIADLDNSPSGGFAGSITAALFLRRFVTETPRYMHFDVFGWSPSAEPGRPKGGAGQAIRALYQALPGMLEK